MGDELKRKCSMCGEEMKNINVLLNINDSYKAPEAMMNLLYDKNKRENKFIEFLELFHKDVSYEWFHEYFENEHADRKKHKQDFTPHEVGELLARLTGNPNNRMIYDCCSGTGTLVIKKWWDILIKEGPFKYCPNDYLFVCEDLSDRTIPFLLFNLIIRGMNAVVIQCDVLTRECYGIFLIQNIDNDYMHFSNFNVMPYSKDVEKYFHVKFIDKKYKPHIENDISLAGCKNE